MKSLLSVCCDRDVREGDYLPLSHKQIVQKYSTYCILFYASVQVTLNISLLIDVSIKISIRQNIFLLS